MTDPTEGEPVDPLTRLAQLVNEVQEQSAAPVGRPANAYTARARPFHPLAVAPRPTGSPGRGARDGSK